MSEVKKEEKKPRQILIETNGNYIQLKKAEVAGNLEMIAILGSLLDHFRELNNINK